MRNDTTVKDRISPRMEGWDYSSTGVYFITCCSYDREWLFGRVVEGRMVLNDIGRIVAEEWRRSEKIRPEITLDDYVIMPNHLHGIVVIAPFGHVQDGIYPRPEQFTCVGRSTKTDGGVDVGTHGRASLHRRPRSLGSFVAGFKSAATKRINALRETPSVPVWQPRYHDRIIRNRAEHEAIRWYIRHNPARWERDYLNV